MANKDKIIELLESTNRKGIKELIQYMESIDFFNSPASTKYHGSYNGGLAQHSLNVYNEFKSLNYTLNLNLDMDSIIIVSILHDLCKAGAYIKNDGYSGYSYNQQHPKGHALLSIERIKKFIELSDYEELLIKYHMGMYGTNEFSDYANEYPLLELTNTYQKNPICKLFYFCDEIATFKEQNDK